MGYEVGEQEAAQQQLVKILERVNCAEGEVTYGVYSLQQNS